MKKKIFAISTALFLLCACLPLGAVSVSAATFGDLTYEIKDGEVTITGCDKNATSVEIPATIEDCPVTTIGNVAFLNCKSLTSVTIPDSVTTIGEEAFFGCSSLTEVTIPSSVTSIGERAFVNCESLKSVTIPDSVTTIEGNAFSSCDSLTSITVDKNNPNYCSVDGVLFNKGKTTLIQYPGGKSGAYTIPDGVTTIGYSAFSGCTSLTSVTIPDSVTTIEGNAFSSCDDLQSVTIGDSVTTIGKLAFFYCKSLTSVTIPDSVTTIGEGAFDACTSLTEVTIPSSVTSIGGAAFKGTSLKTVYYDGDKTDRAIIAVGSNNESLQNAVWHYEDADKGKKNSEEVPSAKEGFHWWMVVAIVSLITNALLLFLLLKKKKSA